MKNKITAVSKTKQTGKIFYFVQSGIPVRVGIVQQKGIIRKRVYPFSGSYNQAVAFMKQLAKGTVTALCLKDLCEDYKNE